MPPPNTRQQGSRPEVMPPQEPQAPEQEPQAPKQEPPAESGMDKASNFMKGLFGR